MKSRGTRCCKKQRGATTHENVFHNRLMITYLILAWTILQHELQNCPKAILLPLCKRRHGAEDGLGIAAGEEAELGAAIVKKVELDVVRAQLKLFFFVSWREG